MDAREERGLAIAAKYNLTKKGDAWLVPSQSENGEKYTVIPGTKCSCPDHDVRQVKCKHIWAVEYVLERETAQDGRVTETETVKVTKVRRKTYSQNWTAYNAAQSEEKTRFGVLLADLCRGIQQPIHEGRGRPALPLADMLFASAYKVYTGFSSRRFTSDLRDAKTEGLVASTPHFNSVTNYLSNADMTPILKHLVTVSSLPLKAVETQFAADSSGFTTSRFIRWYNKKYGREIDNREWVKVHLMCGVNTHVVTSVDVSGWESHDTNYFVPLVEQPARNFHMAEVSADKPESTEGHRWTARGQRKGVGEGATGEMAWGLGVDGRPADGLQSPHRAPKALCGSCDARDGERIRSRGLSRPGWREIAGTLGQLQAGRQAGNGMACSRAKARLNWVSQGQRRGRCKVRRRAERVIRPTRAKTRRLRVLVITVRSPRPIRAVQRARLCAITWTASQAPLAAKRADGMWFSPTPYLRSRMAFSTSAWRR